MITSVLDFISAIKSDLNGWGNITPWFRGESGDIETLCPKISQYNASEENHFLQTFRRKACGLTNTPERSQTDLWLFLAQHYGIPTRLLDWTEGALPALYFAINKRQSNPAVFMLNSYRLNKLAIPGLYQDNLNYLLTWIGPARENIRLAWELRNNDKGSDLPIAIPATYQDSRMIAQRSCFTVHGKLLGSLPKLISDKKAPLSSYLIEYRIDPNFQGSLLKELAILGVTGSTIFPDLDHLGKDISNERLPQHFPT